MPLVHFPGNSCNYDAPLHLPLIVISYSTYESKSIKLSDNFLSCYPIYTNKRITEDYLDLYKTITFKEDDELREILLKDKPNELSIIVYDREGLVIRKFDMFGVEYEKMDDYKISIKFRNFEDYYF